MEQEILHGRGTGLLIIETDNSLESVINCETVDKSPLDPVSLPIEIEMTTVTSEVIYSTGLEVERVGNAMLTCTKGLLNPCPTRVNNVVYNNNH